MIADFKEGREVEFFCLTAFRDEAEPLVARLGSLRPTSATGFSTGELTAESGSTYRALFFAQGCGSGTNEASEITSRAISEFKPRVVLLVGIAAGFPENGILYGDVLVPAHVDCYEKAKRKPGQRIPRGPFLNVTAYQLIEIARDISLGDGAWSSEVSVPRPEAMERDIALIHAPQEGVVGSGDKIVADELSEERQYLLQRHETRAMGLEMESAGAGLVCLHRLTLFAVVKGVQDYGKEEKDRPGAKDRWRSYAADAAALVALKLMRKWRPPSVGRSVPVDQHSPRQLEQAVCLKAEADFGIRRDELRRSPIPPDFVKKLEDNRQREWHPSSVMAQSLNLHVEGYLIPLIRERIQLEKDLRRTYRLPFTPERIQAIELQVRELVLEEWRSIIHEGFADAVRHVDRIMPGSSSNYKIRDLEDQRDRGLKQVPERLLELVGKMLQSAMADSMLWQ